MTDRIAELEKLLSRATSGPWEDASTDNGPFDYEVHTVGDDSWSLVGLMPSPHDARLIASLITAAPDLLAVARAARVVDRVPIPDGTVVVPQSDGVVEMPLTWGYVLADLRAALANLGGAT